MPEMRDDDARGPGGNRDWCGNPLADIKFQSRARADGKLGHDSAKQTLSAGNGTTRADLFAADGTVSGHWRAALRWLRSANRDVPACEEVRA